MQLPLEIERELLTPNQVSARLADGEDPLELTLIKWQGIRRAVDFLAERNVPYRYYGVLDYYLNYKSCGLCLDAIRRHEGTLGKLRYREDKCRLCILADVDRCVDKGSAFDKICRIIDDGIAYLADRGAAERHKELTAEFAKLVKLIDVMVGNLTLLIKQTK